MTVGGKNYDALATVANQPKVWDMDEARKEKARCQVARHAGSREDYDQLINMLGLGAESGLEA